MIGVETQRDGTLRLVKHEGAGNDFLVLVDLDDTLALTPAEVRVLCHRRRGVGADGFIRLLPGGNGAEVTMELWNADGSPAETSGNGLRCVAQAAVDAGIVRPPRFTVATAAGTATVDYEDCGPGQPARATVDMGAVRLVGPSGTDASGRPVQRADAGNPHLVVRCDDPAAIDLATEGAALAADFDGGINVEFVAPGTARDELTMRVFERGVGETWACGSGSCAAAAVSRFWGLVGDRVQVKNPGGTLDVELGPKDGDPVRLSGPVRRVALVEVRRGTLT